MFTQTWYQTFLRQFLTRGYLHSNAAQVLRGAQSVSKKLEQRVKELEGLLKDREVRALLACDCFKYALLTSISSCCVYIWVHNLHFVSGPSGEGRARPGRATRPTHAGWLIICNNHTVIPIFRLWISYIFFPHSNFLSLLSHRVPISWDRTWSQPKSTMQKCVNVDAGIPQMLIVFASNQWFDARQRTHISCDDIFWLHREFANVM